MKLSETVFRLDSAKNSAAYLLLTDGGATLIDTGSASCGRNLLGELESLNVKSIRQILLTHHDIDHIGNMSMLQHRFGCPVYINSLDLPYIQGRMRRTGIKALIDIFVRTDISAALLPLESSTFSGITVIRTPGHTPGHSCFIFEGFLFSGDLFRLPKGRLIPSRKCMNWNTDFLLQSLRETLDIPVEWVCPAHYPVVRRDSILSQV